MRCAAQSVGEINLSGVAQLIHDQRHYQGHRSLYHPYILGKGMYHITLEKYEYKRGYGGKRKYYMVAGKRNPAHLAPVAQSGGIGHQHRNGVTHAIVDAETESTGYDNNLKCRKRYRAQPSGHHRCKCK